MADYHMYDERSTPSVRSRSTLMAISGLSIACAAVSAIALTPDSPSMLAAMPWTVMTSRDSSAPAWHMGVSAFLLRSDNADHVHAWDSARCPIAELCQSCQEQTAGTRISIIAGLVAAFASLLWEWRRLYDCDSAEAKRGAVTSNVLACVAMSYALFHFEHSCTGEELTALGFESVQGMGYHVMLVGAFIRLLMAIVHAKIPVADAYALELPMSQPVHKFVNSSTYARPVSQPLQAGYVPDGLTPAQYEARKKKESEARKKKEAFWSVKRTKPVEDLTSFQAERASKFSNKQISEGLGRKYVKEKYKGDQGSRKPQWRGAKDPKEVGGLMKNFNLDLSFINLSGKPPATDEKKKGKK